MAWVSASREGRPSWPRPESQVLGVRVVDDIIWGHPRDFEVDIAALLADVGLSGMEHRETSGLSGGQLQRLAVAAALARRPRLLISDESTAMIDADGRRRLVGLLSGLPHRRDMSVVHVTHRFRETLGADHVVRLAAGRVVDAQAAGGPLASPGRVEGGPVEGCVAGGVGDPIPVGPDGPAPPPPKPARSRWSGSATSATSTPTGHPGPTPPSTTSISTFTPVRACSSSEGNGSGKSTLAWVLAGLLRPTFGVCELRGRPVDGQIGSVGIAFQHARLQVQRSTVGPRRVRRRRRRARRRRVGPAARRLDPGQLWDRAVDELSGGQLRRVALAGLLARVPSVLVLDEPLAGLDDSSCAAFLAVLADLRAAHGLTLVIISHDLEGAGDVCDRVVTLEAGRVTADRSLVAVPVGSG